MKFKFATFKDNGVTRISFSREEIITMRSSITEKERAEFNLEGVIKFMEIMEAEILDH